MAAKAPVTWEQRIARAKKLYPHIDKVDWKVALRDDELLGRIYLDLIRIGNVPIRRGHRPVPSEEEASAAIRSMHGLDFTVRPFREAFEILVGERSLRHIASRTGLSRDRVARLLAGSRPRPDDMEAIARGFGKRPTYFVEYRTAAVSTLIAEHLEADPDRSAVLVHKLGIA